MEVIVNKQVVFKTTQFLEIFSVHPPVYLFNIESDRLASQLIQLAWNWMSCADCHTLSEMYIDQRGMRYVCDIVDRDKIPLPSIQWSFKYDPYVGKKKCTKCVYYKKCKGKTYCWYRGLDFDRTKFPDRCSDWFEASRLKFDSNTLLHLKRYK